VLALALACDGRTVMGGAISDGGSDATRTEVPAQTAASPEDQACAQHQVSGCGDDATCVKVSGRPRDANRACWAGSQAVACRLAGLLCGESLTVAQDPTGRCWLFQNTCIPVGWSAVAQDGTSPCPLSPPIDCP
jgi:hypothetical protein